MLTIGNHHLDIQHWTAQGGTVEDVAFVCFTTKGDEVFECSVVIFDVWDAGSVNAAEVAARKAAVKHGKDLLADIRARERQRKADRRKSDEEYFGKPSGRP